MGCLENGGNLIIAGPSESQLDGMASAVIRGSCDQIMQKILTELKIPMPKGTPVLKEESKSDYKEAKNIKVLAKGAKKPTYLANVNRGPILLTAPHSALIYRGGKTSDTKVRLHMREHWTSTIVLMLSKSIAEQ